MINVSNEFRQYLCEDKRNYLVYADITLADGTILNLDSTQIWSGGFKIEDAVSGNTKFEIGSAIANKLTLTINNIYDAFSPYDFAGAEVVAYVALELPETTEKIRKGTFIVDDPKYNGTTITLECLDYMSKFDQAYSESKLAYPTTIQSIVLDACSVCGVTLSRSDFDNCNYVVPERPADEALTFRDAIAGCAQLAGCFARCDTWGRLEMKWFEQGIFERNDNLDGGTFHVEGNAAYPYGDRADGGTLNPWSAGDKYDGGTFADQSRYHHLYSLSSPTVSTDDVVITGVQVTENFTETETSKMGSVLFGTAGYVLSVENNKWIQEGEAAAVAKYLGEKIVGLRFRPLSASCLSDPTMEAGDLAYVTDRKQNTYHALVTSTTFHKGSYQQVTCSAETPSKNSSTSYSAATRLLVEARRAAEKQLSNYELAAQQMNQLAANSMGFYFTTEKQPNGSVISYRHDKPTLAESKIIYKTTAAGFFLSQDGGKTYAAGFDDQGNAVLNILSAIGINFDWARGGTLTLGGNNNQHGTLKMLNASGVQIGKWDKDGIESASSTGEYKTTVKSGGLFVGKDGEEFARFRASYWLADPDKKGVGLGITGTGTYLAFSVGEVGTGYTHMVLNAGLNPSGYTEAIIMFPKVRFRDGIITEGDVITGGSISTGWNIKFDGHDRGIQNKDGLWIFATHKTQMRVGENSLDLFLNGKAIYASSAIVQTSDEYKKNSIRALDKNYETFFDLLEPVSYKFNGGQSGRTHTGFGARQVKEALEEAGLSTQEFAGYVESTDYEECEVIETDDEGNQSTHIQMTEVGTTCGLRYEEFISLAINEIQKLKKDLKKANERIEKLERGS